MTDDELKVFMEVMDRFADGRIISLQDQEIMLSGIGFLYLSYRSNPTIEAKLITENEALKTENARLLAIAGAQDLYAHDDSPYKRVEVNQKFQWGED
jgi:hypothetical protein